MDIEIEEVLQNFINNIEPKIIEIDGPDYYISQSKVIINPELLIVGINPAGNKKLKESEYKNKKPENLVYNSNQYLENPNWKISKNLNFIFSGENSKSIYENSVILNYVAINSNSESDLKKTELLNLVNECKKLSNHLIYNVIKPKLILLLGTSVAKMMNISFDHIKDSVLRTDDNKNYLVIRITQNDIPHYLIFHPSTPALNGMEHLRMKKDFFEKLFTE